MTMARSMITGVGIEVEFPEEQCYPLGIPSLVYQDEDDIPTVVRVRPRKPLTIKPWHAICFFGFLAWFVLVTLLVIVR